MNVQTYLPKYRELDLRQYTARDLLQLRGDLFGAFCQRETHNGGIDPSHSLSIPKGQENVRVLFARTVEELLEARDSTERDHFLEELIDAINFGTAIVFLNHGSGVLLDQLADELQGLLEMKHYPVPVPASGPIDLRVFDIRIIRILQAFSPLLEKLRNRAWQNGAQHPYFLGSRQIQIAIRALWAEVMACFDSPEDFIRMYLAKADVLKFRLETKY